MTGRAAARALSGVVGSEEQARILLRAGACGSTHPGGAVLLYDEQRVQAVAGRPFVEETALVSACPHGLYVSRLARTAALDLAQSWDLVASQVRQRPVMPPMTAALLAARVRLAGRLPWVATLCGFVVHGADLTGFGTEPDGRDEFRLEPPGEWYEHLEQRWLPTGRGGRPWVIWDPLLPPILSSSRR